MSHIIQERGAHMVNRHIARYIENVKIRFISFIGSIC